MPDQEPDKQEGLLAKLLRLLKEGEQSERHELREWLGGLGRQERRALLERLEHEREQRREQLERLERSERFEVVPWEATEQETEPPEWQEQLEELERGKWPERLRQQALQVRREQQAMQDLLGQPGLLYAAIKYLREPKQPSALESAAPISLYFDLDNFGPTDIADIIALLSELYTDIGGDSLVIDDVTLLDFQPAIVPVEG